MSCATLVQRRHVPFHTIDAECGGRKRNRKCYLPAQDLCAEEQKQNEGEKGGNSGVRSLGEEFVAKNAAPCLMDQISHSHSSCDCVRFRGAT